MDRIKEEDRQNFCGNETSQTMKWEYPRMKEKISTVLR